jgi:hypothetical protein
MRIRTIKPEFWANETLSALPEATHMLAAALLNYADDEGYFNANPALVRASCCPLREPSVSVQGSLSQLSNVGYVRLGTGLDGRRYGQVVKFSEHQRINRPSASKFKDIEIAWDSSPTPHAPLTDPSPPEGNREQGTGNVERNREQSLSAAPTVVLVPRETGGVLEGERKTADAIERVFSHWQSCHQHPKAQLDPKRRRLIRERLKGYSEADLCQSISGYLNSPHHMGENSNGTVYDDIETMLRDAKHVDMGLRFYRQPPRQAPTAATEMADALRNFVARDSEGEIVCAS